MRIAFIGTGGIARQHASGLAKRENIEFVGAFDALPERAHEFTVAYGGQSYKNVTDLLDEAKPEAVWVCLPPFAHGEAERALLDRRIPFLVEKPVSNSLDTARRILDDVQAMTMGDIQDGIHITGDPGIVDRHDGFGAWGDGRLD